MKNTKPRKIPCAVFRYIEYELYNLEFHKEEIRRIKEEILLKSPERFQTGKAGVSDQTGNKAVRMVSDMRIFHLERNIQAVEASLRRQIFKEIYEWKYRRCCPWQEVCERMNVSEATYYRIRRALIADIGRRIGVLKS